MSMPTSRQVQVIHYRAASGFKKPLRCPARPIKLSKLLDFAD